MPVRRRGRYLVSASLAGVVVTEETAPYLGVAYAAISVIASDVASVPLQVVGRDPSGGRAIDTAHPAHDLISHAPNPEPLAGSYWQFDALAPPDERQQLFGDRAGFDAPAGGARPPRPPGRRRSRTDDHTLFYQVEGRAIWPWTSSISRTWASMG